ncbi:unnamed protein product [Chrysodeixis includens]|uniref:Uncharacterized protein n=1 Tax=Chrysodeixis includens TaxID=689277 RepID=A0A9P0BZV5_CHRIL|nr:unnamed protein product [Chrysodeixis includens]
METLSQTTASLDASSFPDCRLSYFYALANETLSNTYSRKLNAIEQDDKSIADRKIRDKNRFFAKIPIGEPRPMPIVMSTTTVKPIEAVTEKLVPGSGSATVYSVSVLFVIILINTFIR